MGSVNAFAKAPITLSTHGEHNDTTARRSKRPRLAEDALVAIQIRSAHEDTSLEADHMILDYTAHHTIKACLANRDPIQQSRSVGSLSACLSMSEAFLSIFKARHPAYTADPNLTFRIKLLKLATLFTQRLTRNPTTPSETSLELLRKSNGERAWKWIGDSADAPSSIFSSDGFNVQLPLLAEEYERNRAHVLQQLDVPAEDGDTEDAFYGTNCCLSLLDVLPLFIEVSAARNAMSKSNLSERWMHLASNFMLQASLEQYLVVGSSGLDVIDEAFSWGYQTESDAEVQQDAEINEMFEDEDENIEVEGWSAIKTSYLKRLVPPGTMQVNSSSEGDRAEADLIPHLETVAAAFSIIGFEQSVLEFLSALSKSIPEPVLVQLESGKLDGMTEEETQGFLAACGINMARLFET